ncbi:MAG: hypothetical protein AXW17_02420 [Colwellia sp. Phe_37]|jgi:signal transduction histidine kinase|nr:MAG: hypothetical protein AXW17_02420 [Colwellia sp. Phe_37]|tara:strand:+ start:7430 stop:7894 length:465 start_codon:yes stop_codon:yes gene_type:complete
MIIHQHLSIFAQARDQSRDQHRSSIARYISRHKYERTSFAKFIPKRKTSFADKCSNDDNTHSQAKATADAFLKLRAKVVIDISNYGPIIPEQIAKEVFVPRYTTKIEGSGVGLALSRQIMLPHQGSILLPNNNNMTTRENTENEPSQNASGGDF